MSVLSSLWEKIKGSSETGRFNLTDLYNGWIKQLSTKFGSEDWLIRVIFVEIGVIFILVATIVLYWKIYGPSIDRLLSDKSLDSDIRRKSDADRSRHHIKEE